MAESISVIGAHYSTAGVDHSRNKRLFVGSLDRDKTSDDVLRAMKEHVTGVMNVIMYPSQQNQAQNRGYAFVEFDTHENAVRARDELRQSPPKLWGSSQIKVDWAEPENEVDDETMSKVKILFVRKLAPETTEETLRREFERFGPLERVKRQNDHAFVHFTERQHADVARKSKNNTMLDGCNIEVLWSKPVNREHQRQNRKSRPMANNPFVSFPVINGFPSHMFSGVPHLPAGTQRIENPAHFFNGVNLYGGEALVPAIPAPVRLPTLTPHLPATPFDPQHQPQLPSLSAPPGILIEDPPRGGHVSHQLGSAPGALRSSIAPQVDTRPYPVPSAVQQQHQQQQQHLQQQQQIQLQQVPRTLPQYSPWPQLSFVASSIQLPHAAASGPLYTSGEQLTGLDFQTMGPHLASGFPIPYMPYQHEIYGQPYPEN